MNEQNRQRLDRITQRHARRTARGSGEADGDATFLSGFGRARDEVLRPVMEEIGAQLRSAGYDFRVACVGGAASPAVDLRVLIAGRGDSKDTIRFFAHNDSVRGWQVIAELELRRSPVELTRFEANEEMTRDVVEQLVVDAVEQLFASTTGAPRHAPGSYAQGPAPLPAPAQRAPFPARFEVLPVADLAPPPRAPDHHVAPPAGVAPSQAAEPAPSTRAIVVERLRSGRRLHGLDLVGADLSGLDLTGAPLSALDLRGANLQRCVLAGARLMAARLDGADLTDANLTDANLSRADLSRAVLVRARFDGAVLIGAVGVSLPGQAAAGASIPAGAEASPPIERVPALDPLPDHAPAPLADAPARAPEPPAPAVAPDRPTYLAPSRAPLGGTSLALDLPPLDALPFARSAGQAPPPPAARPPPARQSAAPPAAPPAVPPPAPPPAALPRVHRAPAALSGTAQTLDVPRGPALPFARSASDDPPLLTLEEYAALRAHLAVKGEADPPTWRRFGIASTAAKEALQASFAARFREDPSTQARFVELVRRMMDELRADATST